MPHRFYTPDILEKSHDNHCELMEAIESRDLERAEDVLKRHWGKDFFGETANRNGDKPLAKKNEQEGKGLRILKTERAFSLTPASASTGARNNIRRRPN